ncbi:hypothetical protein BG006_003512 [Podila minutissima]|uniref:Methyltransferase n=1 Tax=Podila minutissima TaxID=64525 RepID=A0A9P5SN61_9FUNG|nr:hypothetical protein BG006_003512 [Podila minutissima]
MGNAKSRHAHQNGQPNRKQPSNKRASSSHLQVNTTSSSRFSKKNNHKNNYQNSASASPQPNDSGHYSIHGFMAPNPKRSETPGGHAQGGANGVGDDDSLLGSAPGGLVGVRLSYHPNLSSPGRLDQQKKASDSSLHYQYGSRIKRDPYNKDSNGIENYTSGNSNPTNGTNGHGRASRMFLAEDDSTHYNNNNNNNNNNGHQQYHHQHYPSDNTRPSTSPRPNRISTLLHPSPGPSPAQQQPSRTSVPCNNVNNKDDEYSGGPSMASLSLNPGPGSGAPGSGVLHQQLLRVQDGEGGARTPQPVLKPSELLAGAGPLIDTHAGQPRIPTADQVFARLTRQFPTNPKEAEKRERIYRWLDHVAEALTFNPDTETPGWIIPVIPDELDHPESPFYIDRIAFELDLMAPVGRPFRKAIDIHCSSGEWAMDMALKFPRTIVYALDPLLKLPHLPPRIPENCKFRMRDVQDQDGEFDLVHQRLGAFRTPIQEWTPHFAELRRLTRPGGWIQLSESNGMLVRAGVESLKVNRWVEKAALSSGLNPIQMVEALMPTILGAGMINVECYDYGIPVGEWAGRRGQLAMRKYLAMVESLREEIIEMNRLEEGIFEETIALMQMECAAEKAELVMKVICAQKPPITDDLWR